MQISKIETFSLLIPDFDSDACSSAQDNLVVKISTDEGVFGFGETDTNPWAIGLHSSAKSAPHPLRH